MAFGSLRLGLCVLLYNMCISFALKKLIQKKSTYEHIYNINWIIRGEAGDCSGLPAAWGAGRGVEGHIGLSVCDISTKSITYDSLAPSTCTSTYPYNRWCGFGVVLMVEVHIVYVT